MLADVIRAWCLLAGLARASGDHQRAARFVEIAGKMIEADYRCRCMRSLDRAAGPRRPILPSKPE
jgi:hypothetical protein